MWKGCLLWVAIYVGAVYVVLARSEALELPYPWVPALALGLFVTLALGTLLGIRDAARRQAKPESGPADLRDGATVRLSGVLVPVRAPVRAPISGREAVCCTYSGHAGHQDVLPLRPVKPHWHGVMVAPCILRTRSGDLRILGLPSLRDLPEEVFFGSRYHAAAAQCLAATAWELMGDVVTMDVAAEAGQLAALHRVGDTASGRHFINRQALEQLQMDIGKTAPDTLLPRLAARNWTFNERVVPPGATVTLDGIYRANPPSLDVSRSVDTPDRMLRLGNASRQARRELVTSLLFFVVFAGVAAWGLDDLYRQDGGAVRALAGLWDR
jgi:hypothetical protein